MIKDFFRRKTIRQKATEIVEQAEKGYKAEQDNSKGNKATQKKSAKKLDRAINQISKLTATLSQELDLGIYGKSLLYKEIQNALLEKGYTQESTQQIIESITYNS